MTPIRSINLKVAKASGTFSLGSEWLAFNMVSHTTDPNEVVLSEKKATFGTLIPWGALKFYPSAQDTDVLFSLLTWLAEPGNELSNW